LLVAVLVLVGVGAVLVAVVVGVLVDGPDVAVVVAVAVIVDKTAVVVVVAVGVIVVGTSIWTDPSIVVRGTVRPRVLPSDVGGKTKLSGVTVVTGGLPATKLRSNIGPSAIGGCGKVGASAVHSITLP